MSRAPSKKVAHAHAHAKVKLRKFDGVSVSGPKYLSINGRKSAVCCNGNKTRHTVARTVSAVSKFNANPDASHLTAVQMILRTLKGTVGWNDYCMILE